MFAASAPEFSANRNEQPHRAWTPDGNDHLIFQLGQAEGAFAGLGGHAAGHQPIDGLPHRAALRALAGPRQRTRGRPARSRRTAAGPAVADL